MKLFTRTRVVLMLACLLAAILISSPVSVAQEKSDTALEKKYAPILGDYEFDLTDMGGDVQ